jgi:hypothetical protein
MFEFGDYYYYYFPHFCRLKTFKITYSYFLISPVRKKLLLRCCWWNLIPSRRKDTRALVKNNPLFFPTTTHLYNHACQIIHEMGQFHGKLLHAAELSCSVQAPVVLSLFVSLIILLYFWLHNEICEFGDYYNYYFPHFGVLKSFKITYS